MDEASDRSFYSFPRLVTHVDDNFLAQVTQLYRQLIPQGGVVLDLMSSWVSHLPPEARYSRVIGHGMNAAELGRNRQLTEFFVRDLNQDPSGWALADQSVDAVVCCVSVQYLQQPETVFAEVYRVLQPGGVAIFTFSNRLFYQKAIQAWRDQTGFGRCQLVSSYFSSVAGFTQPEVITQVEGKGGASAAQQGALQALASKLRTLFQRTQGDPFYAVVAYRNFKPVHD